VSTDGDLTAGRPQAPQPAATAQPAEPPRTTAEPTQAAAEPPQAPAEPPRAAEVRVPAARPAQPAPATAVDRLGHALTELRAAVSQAGYPLALPAAAQARAASAALVAQLDDYLLPRLARLDAPLLAVVGGSTGAGKSTLVNSLVSAPVSAAGVLRPTTRAPVLVCHPADAPWFGRPNLLPGLTRTTGLARDTHTLQIVSAPALTPGLALLDAPDIDSVVDANRVLANQLLAAADLWLFVTTAARYADAVPWGALATARERGAAVALVLDRVPPEGAREVTEHFTEMLAEHGFAGATLFVVPETSVDGQGLLPEKVTAPLRGWLATLARDAAARAGVVRQTMAGAVAATGPLVVGLAAAAEEQVRTAEGLAERARSAYGTALGAVEHGIRDGAVLRGEVLARWQEFVGTGELLSTLQARIGQLRDRLVAALTGRPTPGVELKVALETSLGQLIRSAAADAAEQAYASWQAEPAGAALLVDAREERMGRHSARQCGPTDLSRPSPDLAEQVERLVRDWQRGVLELVRTEAADKRTAARVAAYAVNATGLLVMIGVFASTAFIPTGAELAVAGGTTVAAQKVLEAVFGDQAIRTLAGQARKDLLARVRTLLDSEAARYLDRVADLGVDGEDAARLRAAARTVTTAAAAADLVPQAPLPAPPQSAGETATVDLGSDQDTEPDTDQATEPATDHVTEPGTEQVAGPGTDRARDAAPSSAEGGARDAGTERGDSRAAVG